MLAKNVNDNALIQDERGALKFFASKLAPTKCCSELFIVNPPVVQLFSLNCSFLFIGERPFCLTH